MKVIVAHPGKQHSYRLATAVKKNGDLYKYITTIYNKDTSYIYKLMNCFLGSDNKERAKKRKCEYLDDNEVIQFNKCLGIIILFLVRIPIFNRLYNFANLIMANSFGKKVANYAIKHNVDMVIMYDTNAAKCFKILKSKAPNIKRVLDASIANRIYTKELYENISEEKYLKNMKEQDYFLWEKKYIKSYKDEIKYTEYVLCASDFVKDSYIYSGVDENKIFLLPYGTNFSCKEYFPRKIKDKVDFLFVGQFSLRKGITYLLKSIENIENANLHIVGFYDVNSNLYKKYSKNNNIKFYGQLLQNEVRDIMQKCDVYVFPSLCEGMSLSCLEAMSCGLPLIVTKNSGVSNLMNNNGFIINAGDDAEISNAMMKFISNRELINKLGEKSYKLSLNYTWLEYEKNLSNILGIIGENK